MAQVLSNDHFIAANHRVLQSSTYDRYSRAFFFNPKSSADIAPLPGLVAADRKCRAAAHIDGGVSRLCNAFPAAAPFFGLQRVTHNTAQRAVGGCCKAGKLKKGSIFNGVAAVAVACCVYTHLPPAGGPRYRAINWQDFRMQRFAGDYADVGEEVQIDWYRLEGDAGKQ